MPEVIRARDYRKRDRVELPSKEDRQEEREEQKKTSKRRKDARKIVKEFKDKPFGKLNDAEKDLLLKAVAIRLGLIES